MICVIMEDIMRLAECVYRDAENTYIENLEKAELSGFKEKLGLFSHFLCSTNKDYKYNETYLISFVDRFLKFQEYIRIKKAIFVELVKVAYLHFAENFDEDVEITIDQYWRYHRNALDYILPDENIICRENITMRAEKNTEKGRDVFIKDYEIIKEGKIIQKQLKKMAAEFAFWLGEISNYEDKQEEITEYGDIQKADK